ncbi:hypothetical protein [Aeromonas sanarellii]|uniref:hypothetical protein n=1 Tax=Aeromonas sanarellii TaxID=633415 RepID=UPI0038D05159
MKQYQQSLGLYLVTRRDGDHAMATELAGSLCYYWQERGNEAEQRKWERVLEEHLELVE